MCVCLVCCAVGFVVRLGTSVCKRASVRAVCVCNPAQVLESPAQLVSAVFSVLILTQNVARAFIHPVILYLADRATNSRTVYASYE